MNERMIQNALYRYRDGHPIIVPNIHMRWGEVDLLSIARSGYLYDHEIKISKADFKADRGTSKHGITSPTKALKHDDLRWASERGDRTLPNYFVYVAPVGLLTIYDVPSYAGLLAWHPADSAWSPFGWIEVVKKPPRLHDRKATPDQLQQIARSLMLRYWTQRQSDDPRCPGAAENVS